MGKSYKSLVLWLIIIILAAFNGLFIYNNKKLNEKVQELQELQYTYQDLKFDKYIYDFGELNYQEKAVAKFKFTNMNTSPISIANVKTSCGCTTPTWPKTPILPNGTGEIQVTYDTRIKGKFVKQIHVELSNTNSSPIALTIMGNVN